MKQITVLLAEDHAILREGVRSLVETEEDMMIVGEAADGRQAVRLVATLRPDVVIMDIAMPELNGMQATAQILKASPATKILVLSAHADDAYVEQMLAMGVKGYLLKQSCFESLAAAIRAVYKGNVFFSPAIARRRREVDTSSSNRLGVLKKKNVVLTAREAEVLQLVAEGKANKKIALNLAISIKTVEKHRHNLMAKLGIHDTAGLTRYAITTGVIENSVQVTIL
jgi:DNA-binding NarL/FixJ family response regulator